MPTHLSNPPVIELDICSARRFILLRQGLWPAHQLQGKAGVLAFVRAAGSIQFDPINIAGRNPDLVLQSRVADFRPEMLDELLYQDRKLLDGWDKMASIYLTSDWPHFSFRRQALQQNPDPRRPSQEIIEHVLQQIAARGPLSSLDFEASEQVDWYWGPTKAVRAALEHLYNQRQLGIHHRVNNRRYFDLIKRLLPAELLAAPNPHANLEDYHDWHVLRRIGSLGLASNRSAEHWLGIHGLRTSRARQIVIKRLLAQGDLRLVRVNGLAWDLFLSSRDLPLLEQALESSSLPPRAALIAPLDNLMWDRALIAKLFDFDYTWEVYKPKDQRQYGYYVLPVLYGDHLIARAEPRLDKERGVLRLDGWWWQPGITPDPGMQAALQTALLAFSRYLRASGLDVAEALQKRADMGWLSSVQDALSQSTQPGEGR